MSYRIDLRSTRLNSMEMPSSREELDVSSERSRHARAVRPHRDWDQIIEPGVKAARDSEQLSAKDFAIRVNARPALKVEWEPVTIHLVIDDEFGEQDLHTALCGKTLEDRYQSMGDTIDLFDPNLCTSCAGRAALYLICELKVNISR